VDIDPDDTFSSIPYEKGSFFLFYLEQIVGTAEFEVFMKQWIHDVCGKLGLIFGFGFGFLTSMNSNVLFSQASISTLL
jgi:aminopeptidase N